MSDRPRSPAAERVVVTGASGNVGTALLRHRDPRWAVTGVARRVPPAVEPYSAARWVPCDIGAPGADGDLADVFAGADVVVHLAWAISPSPADPPMIRTNATGTRNVLAAAARAGVPHVVCASSVAAYRPAGRWQRVAEDWPRGGVPASAYSRSKVRLERQLDEFVGAHPDVRLTRVRPCGIVQRAAAGQFARWLLGPLLPERLLGAVPKPLWRDLRLQLVHADDVADALRRIVDRRIAGAVNLAAEPPLTADDLVRIVGGVRFPVGRRLTELAAWAGWRVGLQPLHPGWLELADRAPLIDTSRAREELGWLPEYSAADALRDLLAGFATHAGTASAPLAPAGTGAATRLRAVRWGRPARQA
ncbi:Nucleoside-diphosphate-sugar epimerase [Amycolatopsis arida]|uniref:Nucleoside-diphosphate-sugar epimerase n=1 Tax=Amycolatopsis arida TaxID=587909 RepID=A0A1I5YF18_9PSEU|nr:NAD-dependent epimerase/dehydratase family protein [Amycolatopsis arida]TDX90451.1 nucleoside-diphosphate-sugar epimerase [Amycolatopsis arida]SFQ42487.1 Nucleoside-diphosphate-sugar epimerase [Amycolatopsis arida]